MTDQAVTLDTSDGYHSFRELYTHRAALTAALCRAVADVATPYRSRLHHDGTMYDGMFIVGLDLPGAGPVSYHYDLERWDDFGHVAEVERAPEFDGHTSDDVVVRLNGWASR